MRPAPPLVIALALALLGVVDALRDAPYHRLIMTLRGHRDGSPAKGKRRLLARGALSAALGIVLLLAVAASLGNSLLAEPVQVSEPLAETGTEEAARPSGPVLPLSFPMPQGGEYAGEYRPATGGNGPAMMLITAKHHQPSSMNSVAEPLREAGYSVLTVKCPYKAPLVEMPDGRMLLKPGYIPADHLKELQRSAKIALTHLSGEPTADSSRIGLVGAGMGANIAAMLGGSDPESVPVMVFVAPGGMCDRVTMHHKLARSRNIPTLLMATTSRNLFTKTFIDFQGPGWKLIEGTTVPSGGFLNDVDSMSLYAEPIVSWVKEHYPITAP